jgi:SPP1 gp7 family putative phage head morphogenesis protein
MKNDAYWANRMRILEDALLDTGYEYVQNLERQYDKAIRDIETDIAHWYQRFAKNNEISLNDARKLLNSQELEEFKWTVEEYIKYGKENAINGAWIKQLENASARVHISRLEAIKLQLQQQAEALAAKQAEAVKGVSEGVYKSSYYHTAFELQKGVGVGWTLHAIDENVIEKVLARPWTLDKQTFSDRIWANKQALVNTVNTQITQMVMRGAAPDNTIKAIADRFKVSKSQAGRLVMTESAAFSNEARKDCFKDLDVEKYVIVETLDGKTCGLCAQLDGKVYPMSEYAIGVTAPPFHPWCRGTTAPYFDDMDDIAERWARDPETGKTYTVPGSMTYKQWAAKSVNGDAKVGLTVAENNDITNFAKIADILILDVDSAASKFTKQEIIEELKTSVIGNRIIEKLEEGPVALKLCNEQQLHSNRGEQYGNSIIIYLSNINNKRVAAQTIIHETTHYYYKIGGCQHAEAVCFAMEKMHLINRDYLTNDEWAQMVKLAVDNYPELKWEDGGYGNYEQFDFVK